MQAPVNANYAATVVQVKVLVPIAGADNIVAMPMFGFTAIVGKETQVGDLGIFFPAECQLSPEYCSENYLFRHENLNKTPEKKGYLEDNRRVRAIKLRGVLSSGLFMPLDSLDFTGEDWHGLKEGDQFDHFGGVEICRKYQIPVRGMRGQRTQSKKEQRVDARLFPEHFETPQFLREVEHLDPSTPVVITQKLHGTSIRVGNVPVRRRLNLLERAAKFLGVRVVEVEYANVYGSRKVIKDANNPDQQHYYGSDLWSTKGKELDGIVPKGYVVYAEIVGWTPEGAPIQSHYTYQKPPKTCELFVYRITHINEDGVAVDLSWDAVREFCAVSGLRHVPELYRTDIRGITEDYKLLMDIKFSEGLDSKDEPVRLSDDSPCDEGICVRAEGIVPRIWKVKSPVFLGHETKMLDKGEVDVESSESSEAAEEVVGVGV